MHFGEESKMTNCFYCRENRPGFRDLPPLETITQKFVSQHFYNEQVCTPALREGTSPCGITPKHKPGVLCPLETWPLLWISAFLNSSCKVCLWKHLCRSGHGVIGEPVHVCWLGRVTSFVCFSCSIRIQGLSSFIQVLIFKKCMGTLSWRLSPMSCLWLIPANCIQISLGVWRLAESVITEDLSLYET